MKEEGVSLTAIGLFALVGLPYVLKFTWAPLIDAVHVPGLTRWLGRRRAWLITTQLALIAAIVGLGSIDPVAAPVTTAALALAITFCSASQDIVVDAFRIESLSEERQAAGMANYVAGYRVALLISTAGMFEIVAIVQAGGMAGSAAWFVGYAIAAALIAIGMVTVLLSDEPDGLDDQTACSQSADHFASGSAFLAAVIDPFREFLQRPMWVGVLLFVMLFKFGDAFAGIMTAPFVLDIGFDKTDYGRIVKVFGFAAVLIGGFAGGYVYRVAGTITSLWIAGLVQMLSNLMFVWQAVAGADYSLLVLTIGVENFTGGLGTVIFVAFISSLCRDRAYTATQFALLSALAAVGRTVLSASAGWFADTIGWPAFFVLTTGAAVPGLLLLWWLVRADALAPRDPVGATAPTP